MDDQEFERMLAQGVRAIARDGRRPYDAAAMSRSVVGARRSFLDGLVGRGRRGPGAGSLSRASVVGLAVLGLTILAVVGLALGPGAREETVRPATSPLPSAPAASGGVVASEAPDGWTTPVGRIAFLRDGRLWTSSLDGGGEVQAQTPVPPRGFETLAWDPTGARLAAIGAQPDDGRPRSLVILDRTGATLRTANVPPANLRVDLGWAPDGSRLAVTGVGLDSQGLSSRAYLRIVGVDPADDRDISLPSDLTYENEERAVAWSPDGAWIAFTGCQPTDARQGRPCSAFKGLVGDVWIVRPDGTGARRLTSGDYDYAPAWIGPDRLAFARWHLGDQQVWSVGIDGTDPAPLNIPGPTVEVADWNNGIHVSPEGDRLAYVPRGSDRVVIVDLTGRSPDRQVVLQGRVPAMDLTSLDVLSWTPDGGSLLLVKDRVYELRLADESVHPLKAAASLDVSGSSALVPAAVTPVP